MPADTIVERIVEQIISENPVISRQEILKRFELERKKASGLFSDATLLRVIAMEFGVAISQDETTAIRLSIGDLVPSLSDVTVVGRVVAVFSPKTFEGKRSGTFASLLITERDNILRVVLWNDKAKLAEDEGISVGQIVRFSHGYTRENRSGMVELHVGEKCEIEINPKDVDPKNFPTISKFATPLGEITHAHKNKKIHVIGKVKETFSAHTFNRQDSSWGKVMHFVLADRTGEIPVVVWNEKVDEIEKILKKGTELQIVNAKVKKALSASLEIHVEMNTYVAEYISAEEFLRIAQLKEGMTGINVEGEVATKPVMRKVKTYKGETVKLAVFELKDETGKIWVLAWRKHAETAGNLKLGEKVIIKNVQVKKGFADQLELSTKNASTIIKN